MGNKDNRLYRLRPVVPPDAPEDNVVVVMSQQQVKKHGIKLDPFGIPTVESLSDWHRKNNPQLFVEKEEGSDGTE